MRNLIDTWKQWRAVLDDAQYVHDTISTRKEPTLVDILLPLAYRHLLAHERVFENKKASDTALAGFAGHYLGRVYPELREYVMTPVQRERLRELRSQLEDTLRNAQGDAS